MALTRSLFRVSRINNNRVLTQESVSSLARFLGCSTTMSLHSNLAPTTTSTRWSVYRHIHDGKSKIDSKVPTPEEQQRVDSSEIEEQGMNSKIKEETNLTQVQRLKKIFSEYGSTAVTFHVCISLTSLGICYGAVKSGLDVPSMLQKIGLSKGFADSAVTTGASTFVIAYACHKVFAPLRMFLTITCTPLIVRKLRIMGILKAPVKPTS